MRPKPIERIQVVVEEVVPRPAEERRPRGESLFVSAQRSRVSEGMEPRANSWLIYGNFSNFSVLICKMSRESTHVLGEL